MKRQRFFLLGTDNVSERGSRDRRSITRCVLLFVLALGLLILSSPAAMAQDDDKDHNDLVILTGRADVAEDETIGDIIIFDGPVNLAGTSTGDIVAFNGSVTVSGNVAGDVFAFNGRVTVEDGGVVGGDVESRKEAQIASGAEVRGDVQGLRVERLDDAFAAVRFGLWIAFTVSALVLALLFVLLFPRAADAVAAAGEARTGASIGWGFLLFFGIPILAVIFLVTIVGIPLGVGLLLVLAPIYGLAYTVASYWLGRKLLGPPKSRLLAALVGVAIVRVAALVPFLGGLVWLAATVFGLGLIYVAARGAGRAEAREPVREPATT
jgi:hypothetical protein